MARAKKGAAKGAALLAEWQRDRMTFRRDVVTLPEDGLPLGDRLAPFQVEDFAGLDAHRHAFLERPRGHSKTFDAAVEVATELMVGRPGAECYAIAADEDQARLLLTDVQGIFQRSALLRPLVKTTKLGVTVTATGSKLTVLPSDAASAYGLRPDLIVADEIAEWRDRKMWDALYTASGKRPRCRVVAIGSAGFDKTGIAWEVREIAQREADWFFSSREQCAPWIDPEWLAQQERTLPAHTFARLHLNRWVDGAGAFLSAEEVAAIFADVPSPDRVVYRALGLDLGLSKDSAVLSLVGACDDGTVLVLALVTYTPRRGERLDLREIEEEAVRTALAMRAPLSLDPWQGVLLGQRAQAQGVEVAEFSFTSDSRRRLFGRVLDLIRTRSLKCGPHDALRRELLGLETSETVSGWRVDHKVGQHDDHVTAVALAIAALAALKLVDLDMSPAERAQLSRLSRHLTGTPMLPPGYALAYDDDGQPIDKRFSSSGVDWGATPSMRGYLDRDVDTSYLDH